MICTVYVLTAQTLCVCVDSKVRLATLELSCLLLKQSVLSGDHCIIKDVHLACLEVQVHTNMEASLINILEQSLSNDVSLGGFFSGNGRK